MKRSLLIVALVVGSLWSAGQTQAQNFNNVGQGIIFYYAMQANQRNQELLRNQQRMQTDLFRFEQQTTRRLERQDPIDAYVRQGRVTAPQNSSLPPIYSGRRQYFMRMDSFNPPMRRF